MASDPWSEKLCAVRAKYLIPKVVGEDKPVTPEDWYTDRSKQLEINDRIEQVINALRLCEIENVYTPVVIHKSSKWAFGHDRSFPGRFQPEIYYSQEVGDEWLQSFVAFWGTLQGQGVKDRKLLYAAMRRFGYAHERHRIEDKMVDLLIAAETLFFSDPKEGSYIGEIKYPFIIESSTVSCRRPRCTASYLSLDESSLQHKK